MAQPIDKIDFFFKRTPTVSRLECDHIAGGIVANGTVVSAVEEQGSLSYTVCCTTKTIISFRRPRAGIDVNVVSLSKNIHGHLGPDATYCGNIGQGEDVLSIYKMTCLPGKSWFALRPKKTVLEGSEKLKCANLYRNLAAYFARQYLKRLSSNSGMEFAVLMSSNEYRNDKEAEASLSLLFGDQYPKVLAHGDLSARNFLVDEDVFAISGIIDWSLAAIRPFGTDLKVLFLLQYFDEDDTGVTFYEGHENLRETFWEEFWRITKLEEDKRPDIRRLAELAGKLTYIIDLAFQRDNGKIVDRLGPFNDICLEGYFGNANKNIDEAFSGGDKLTDMAQGMVI
ncbi:hypothetical protein F5Y16DRAFT_414863 [Xylariaceae sp. FL0255]|nr:hypothetical protein F5Y16DRAFT_414863 [Xylariaceae sp. FL0255]